MWGEMISLEILHVIVVPHDGGEIPLLPHLGLLALSEARHGTLLGRIGEVGPSQDTRLFIKIGRRIGPEILVLEHLVPRLNNVGLAAQLLMQLLPQAWDVLALAGLNDGRLVADTIGPGRAFEVEDSLKALPGGHGAQAAEDGAGCLQVLILDDG